MLGASAIAAGMSNFNPSEIRSRLQSFLPPTASPKEKTAAIEATLRSPVGISLRDSMARWIVDEIVPVERLVPKAYINWRAPVRDSMIFVVSRLSPERLAPKLLEQMELPPEIAPEVRLLRLISKVPGLQKLGQVIARNQHLHPTLRRALTELENGIRDVQPNDIRTIVHQTLGPKINTYYVEVSSTILKEASVSAVVRFTWRNPASGRRERGVFKVLKPHIPEFFKEDMDYLQGLAHYFGDRHHRYGFPAHLIPDTFKKVRRLLRHEVNFRREQRTLAEAAQLYSTYPNVRIPRVIPALCTRTITAMSEEIGKKITNAAAHMPPASRRDVAEELVEALIAVPMFSAVSEPVFHGDPHAGNLLYNSSRRELVILDWALREHLTREHRRHLALLFLMVSLRDAVAVSNEILALAQESIRPGTRRTRMVHDTVADFLTALPSTAFPSAGDAMRLLERVALEGIKFPGSLIMLSKVTFMLEGILADIAGDDLALGPTIARHVALHWLTNRSSFQLPLIRRDWLALQCSALLFPNRVGIRWQKALLDRWLRSKPATESN